MKNPKPLVIDLDGTLIKTDLLFESFLLLIKKNPLFVFLVPFWLLKGKSYLKNKIAERVPIDVKTLPWNQDVLEFTKQEKQQGRELVLATASNERYAEAVSNYFEGLFDHILASSLTINLSGKTKAENLIEQWGSKGFDYIGNSHEDLPVWEASDKSYVVSHDKKLITQAQKTASVEKIFSTGKATIKTWLKAIRVHQWLKNFLIFVPLLASHEVSNLNYWLMSLLAFFAFSFTASSIYILNDLLDLEDDRQHSSKCNRPFAAGLISPLSGILFFPLLLSIAFVLSFAVGINFFITMLVYLFITTAYSFYLKRLVILDVITLAGLYTVRVVAGGVAITVTPSFWLFAFSVFIFLSLALVKRYVELLALKSAGKQSAKGRGYQVDDVEILAPLGAASGYISVLIMALYINSEAVKELYRYPEMLWFVCPILLYWISRTWMIAHRGDMHDDPIVFAAKDLVSQVVAVLVLAIFLIAT